MGIPDHLTTERLHFHFSLSCIGEGNGNTLQCSCLEKPRDGGACWAAVYGVTQSRTRLKRLLLLLLFAGQEATGRTAHGTTDWFQIGKGVHQCYILSPCLFNLYAEYITRLFNLYQSTSREVLGWVKHKLVSRFLREISIT